jgi:hypothetical protein
VFFALSQTLRRRHRSSEGLAQRGLIIARGTVDACFDVMSKPRELRCYAYVNRPYSVVREALQHRPLELLQRATSSAAERASSLAASLRAEAAGIEVGVEVRIHIHALREEEGVAGLSPVTRISLGWEAARTPALFPVMSAELSAWPLSSSETQLEIEGTYRPPLGAVGRAVDAAVGNRIAEASVHRLLEDVVEQLRRTRVTA